MPLALGKARIRQAPGYSINGARDSREYNPGTKQGPYGYVTKPCNIDEVKNKLRRAVEVKTLTMKAERAEQALRRAYEETEKILCSLPCAVLIVDTQYRVVYGNPLVEQYFRKASCALLGTRIDSTLPLSTVQLESLFDFGRQIAVGTNQSHGEVEVNKRVFRYCPFPVDRGSNEHDQIRLVIWDTTEQKQLQDQLIQAEKLASIGTLVFGMAHEVNNPIQGIHGMAEVILDNDDIAFIKECANDILGYTRHVSSVIKDFACYARPASRDEELAIDLNERLTEAAKMVRRNPAYGHVEIVTRFGAVPK